MKRPPANSPASSRFPGNELLLGACVVADSRSLLLLEKLEEDSMQLSRDPSSPQFLADGLNGQKGELPPGWSPSRRCRPSPLKINWPAFQAISFIDSNNC